MKKYTKFIKVFIFIGAIVLLTATAHASATDQFVDQLLPEDEFADMGDENENAALGAYNALPDLSIAQLVAAVVRTLLGWSMILTIIAVVVTGIYFLISQGKDEEISKAKDIILYLLIGLIIMASAYGIIVGLSQFNFLEAV